MERTALFEFRRLQESGSCFGSLAGHSGAVGGPWEAQVSRPGPESLDSSTGAQYLPSGAAVLGSGPHTQRPSLHFCARPRAPRGHRGNNTELARAMYPPSGAAVTCMTMRRAKWRGCSRTHLCLWSKTHLGISFYGSGNSGISS